MSTHVSAHVAADAPGVRRIFDSTRTEIVLPLAFLLL